jgi:hypothetical protein
MPSSDGDKSNYFSAVTGNARVVNIDGSVYQANTVVAANMREAPQSGVTSDHRVDLSVNAATVIQRISAGALLFCCFSLLTYIATGFVIVSPFVAIFAAVASLIFYLMGRMIGRTTNHMA